jgi:hypothetical protein
MLGMLLVVLAYYLLQLERADPRGLAFNLINLLGAGCLPVEILETPREGWKLMTTLPRAQRSSTH